MFLDISEEVEIVEEKKFLGSFNSYAHDLSGDIYSHGEDEIIIENLIYDGKGPDAFFWFGRDGNPPISRKPSLNGILIPYPFEGEFPEAFDKNAKPLPAFNGETVVLKLPDDLKVSDLKWVSVWCRKFQHNFGDLVLNKNMENTGKFLWLCYKLY